MGDFAAPSGHVQGEYDGRDLEMEVTQAGTPRNLGAFNHFEVVWNQCRVRRDSNPRPLP
jgi:hypothetical protein